MPADGLGGSARRVSTPRRRRSSLAALLDTPQRVRQIFERKHSIVHDERHHQHGIFGAILAGDVAEVLQSVQDDCTALERVDAVGATPVHFAFLTRKTDIGKELVMRYPHCATYLYGAGPYVGENVLHIAIMQQNVDLVAWLLRANPTLLNAEVVGEFFAPGGMVYFGGYPLLFAVSSNQRDVLQTILDTHTWAKDEELRNQITLSDRYGNTALHMAVVHDLPDMYDFVLECAAAAAGPAGGDEDDEDDEALGFRHWANHERLTPLALAAAMGKVRMFQHILQKETVTIWVYGPVVCHMVPLSGLDQPVLQRSGAAHFQVAQKTAIECICAGATRPLTNCLKAPRGRVPHDALQARRELVMTDVVRVVLERKWRAFARRKFYSDLALALVAQLLWILSTFVPDHYADGGDRGGGGFGAIVACEAAVAACVLFKLVSSGRGAVFRRRGRVSHSADGPIAWKNRVSAVFCALYVAAWALRLAGLAAAGAVVASFAALAGWLHVFFFLLGFPATGPFVITIKEMIEQDMRRFLGVFSVVVLGYTTALYLLNNDGFGADVFFRYMIELTLLGIAGVWPVSKFISVGGYQYWIVSVLLISWLLFVMVLLLNTVIAMMNNTYHAVEAHAERRWCVEWANIIASYEGEYDLRRLQEFRRAYGVPLKRENSNSDILTKLYLEISVFNEDWRDADGGAGAAAAAAEEARDPGALCQGHGPGTTAAGRASGVEGDGHDPATGPSATAMGGGDRAVAEAHDLLASLDVSHRPDAEVSKSESQSLSDHTAALEWGMRSPIPLTPTPSPIDAVRPVVWPSPTRWC